MEIHHWVHNCIMNLSSILNIVLSTTIKIIESLVSGVDLNLLFDWIRVDGNIIVARFVDT
jgi:hypothetical protein